MLFYKFYVEYESGVNSPDDNENRNARIRKIAEQIGEFNSTLDNKAYYYVYDFEDTSLYGGIIAKEKSKIETYLKAFLKQLNIKYKSYDLSEITLQNTNNYLLRAERRDFIEDKSDVLSKFHIENVSDHHRGNLCYGENLISEETKAHLYEETEKFLFKESILEEFDRIFCEENCKKTKGHPVHYFIYTDDRDTRKKMSRMLLSALYLENRIESKRYCFVDLDDYINEQTFDELCMSCIGGTVLVRIANEDIPSEDEMSGIFDSIETTANVAKKYRNKVLFIYCLPRECRKIKTHILDCMGNMSFVDVKEEFAYGDRAKDYLKMLAKDFGIRSDKNLLSKVEEDTGYLVPDLKAIFDVWYDRKLKTQIYPQYKEIVINKAQIKDNKPVGNAYDELNKMIGLESAKKVIKQSLDYYKAQKIFADMGMKKDDISMHMVFTGNPGTAKTSVARLFAKIMKENGLLSKGHLVECGRSDLVGKYVGWTANIVKEKFQKAKGGVLFIDEAYSLVDDRGGSFGDEAINTIVQEMENHRDELVVIFAGYPNEMENFLEKNPGLRSRIAFHIPFDDYSVSELCEIANYIASNKGIALSQGAIDKLETVFEKAKENSDFGNGRYVRNIIEKAKLAQASRLISMDIENMTRKDVTTINEEDIEIPKSYINEENIIKIGFAG